MAASHVEYRCFVGGLAWATDDNSLNNAFSTYGEVLESKVSPVIHLPSSLYDDFLWLGRKNEILEGGEMGSCPDLWCWRVR